jgi:basic amino acid/polyamine antiporter, APA family
MSGQTGGGAGAAQRVLGLQAAVALVVGEVVGVGIFLTPAEMTRALGSPFWVLVVWLAVGVCVLCGSLCYGQLAARYPEAGGSYLYLREAWGPAVAFLYGWKSLVVMDPGLTAALAAGLAHYVAAIVPIGDQQEKGVAMAAIVILALISALGVRIGASVVRLLAAVKLLLLASVIAWSFASARGAWSNFQPFMEPRPGSAPLLAGLAGGVVAAFFSFGGFWDVAKLGGEVRNPARTLPRALVLGVGTATVVYILTSVTFIYLVPIEAASSGYAFAAQAGAVLFGERGGRVFSVMVAIMIAGSLAAVLMTAPRVYFAMARDGLFLRSMGRLHPRFETPVRAIALQAALACTVVWIAAFDAIIAYFIFATVAFVALTVAGIYRLPPPQTGTVRLPGYLATPLAFLVLLVTLLALLGAGRPLEAALGTAAVALGYPVYRLVASSRPRSPVEETPGPGAST